MTKRHHFILHLLQHWTKSVMYLAVLMPGIHCVFPLIYFFLYRRQFILKEQPHDVNVAAIQPVVINRNCVLLQKKT